MKENTKKQFKALMDKYGLTVEQFFKSQGQGWTIITRDGIDQISAAADITITYDVVEYTPGQSAAVKADGSMGERTIQTFGEAVKGGFPNGNTKTSYVLAIAEKRAMSRAVLKLAGFYALGVFSEDESEDFNRSKGSKLDMIKDTL